MVHGNLNLYWLRFQYNKWQCVFFFIYKTILSNTVVSWNRGSYLFECNYMLETALKYKILTSNISKGKVYNFVYESLRKETFFCPFRWTICVHESHGEGDWWYAGNWRIHFHVDPVKQLAGVLTVFPQAFLIVLYLKRLTEPILETFGLKLFQPKQNKKLTHFWATGMGIFVTVPWWSTVITKFHGNQQQQIGRNKQ